MKSPARFMARYSRALDKTWTGEDQQGQLTCDKDRKKGGEKSPTFLMMAKSP